jgi:hypothetical protein
MVLREARLAPSSLRPALRALGPLLLLSSIVLTGLLGLLAQSASADHTPVPAPSLTGPASPDDSTGPTWTFTEPSSTSTSSSTVTDGATSTVTIEHDYQTQCLYGATPATDADFDATSPTCAPSTYTGAVSGDGTYVLSIRTVETKTESTTTVSADGTDEDTVDGPTVVSYSAVVDAAYVYDDTDPVVTVTLDTASPGSVRQPQWSYTVTDGAAAQCELVGPGGTVHDGPCGGSPFVAPELTTEGAYTLTVRSTDAAGNTGRASSSYELDLTGPSIGITGPTAGTEETVTWTIEVTGASGGATCQLDSGPTFACGATESATLTRDGSVTLTVTAVDAYGNPATASATYTRTTTPGTPTVTAPASPASSKDVTWTVTVGENTTTLACALTRDGTAVPDVDCPTVSGSGTYTVSTTLTDDGEYELTVTASNSTSDTTPSGSATYVLDATAAAGPALTAGHTGTTGSASPLSWTWAVAADHTTDCRLTVDGGTPSAWADCPGSFSVTPTAQGSHTLEVRHVDALGNTGSVSSDSYLYDSVAPAAPSVTREGDAGPRQPGTVAWDVVVPADVVLTHCRVVGPTDVADDVAWETCGARIERSLTGDGTHTLQVRQRDAAGNDSDVTSVTVVIDGTAPAAPMVAGPSGSTSDPTLVWTITPDAVDGGSSVECRLVRDGVVPSTFSACASNYTVADGVYRLEVRAIDDAGNRSAVVSSDPVTVDTTGPAAPGVTLDVTSGRTKSATWTVTPAEAGTTSECRLLHGGVVVLGWAACTAPYAFDLLEGDGVYVLEVRTRDTLGNLGAATTGPGYTLDATPPPAPTVTGSRTGTDNERGITYDFSGEGTATCTLYRGSTLVATYEGCHSSSPFAVTLPEVDGSYTLQVVLTDSFGNPSDPGVSAPYVLDVTPPATPTVTGSRTGTDNERAITYAFTGEGTAVCRLHRDGLLVQTFADCHLAAQPFAVTLPDVSGSYVLTVTYTDAVGNVSVAGSSAPYVLDVTPPGLATVTVSPRTDNVESATWTVTPPESGTTTQCRLLIGATVVLDWRACAAPYSYALTEGDGDYVLEVRVIDAVGNVGPVAVGEPYTLDMTAPPAPVVGSDRTVTDNERQVTYTFSGEGTATCTLLRDGVVIAGPQTCSSSWTVLLPDVSGSYVLRVTYTDAVGNEGAAGSSPVYLLDVTPPTVPTVTGSRTGTDNERAISYTFAGEGTATCQLVRDGVAVGGAVPCTSPWQVELPAQDGSYVLRVTYTDAVGNTSAPGASAPYLLDLTAPPAPSVAGPGSTGNQRTVTWTYSGEGTATCTLLLAGVAVGAPFSCGSTSHSTTLQSDGAWSLRVTFTDAVGNQGLPGTSSTYLLDTVNPGAPQVSGPTGPAQGRTPTWTLATETDTTLQCRLVRGAVVVSDWAACQGSSTADLTGQPDGGYSLEARATDPAGNVGAVTTSTPYVLDSTAPLAPEVTGPLGPSQSGLPRFTWTGEAAAQAQCQLSRDGVVVAEWASCSSGHTPLLTRDGTWTLAVRLVDAAGNTGPASSSSGYVLDTTAPAAPYVTPPKTPGRDLAPSWGVMVEGGASLECRLVDAAGVAGAWAPCSLPVVTSLEGRPDGTYALEVRATDAAQNVSAVGSGSYVLDTAPPAAAVITAPVGPSRNRTPTFTVTTEPGATTSCRLTSGATVISDHAVCTSPVTVDLADLPDGTYTLTVRVNDAAGNPGPSATGTYVLDTTAPAAPLLSLVPATPSPLRSVTWAFGYEPGSTLVCRLTFPTGAVREISGCASPLTVDLTGLPDGSYVLSVRAVDAAGNVGLATTSTHVIDSAALAAPGLTGPVTPGSTRTPTWRIAGAGTTECRLTRGTTVLRDWALCTGTYTADLHGQPDGTYTLAARTRDAAGAVSAATTSRYVLDTVGPAAATLVAPPTPSTNRVPTWTIASPELGATAECQVMVFDSVLTAWAPCGVSVAGSPFSVDLSGLGDGTYTLLVRLTDAAGNRSGTQASSAYVLDTSAPVAVGVTGPPSPGNDPTPTWLLSTGGGASLECRLTSADLVVSDWAPCAGEYTADLTDLPDGPYTLTVRALSEAGTPGAETTVVYTLSTATPDGPGALVEPASPRPNRAPSWTFTLPAGATATCRVVRGSTVIYDGPCSSPFVLDLSSEPDGVYTLAIVAVDAAGNRSDAVTSSYELDTQPTAPPVFTSTPGSTGSTLDPQWRFTVSRGATAQCRLLAGDDVLEDWTTCTSPYTALLSGRPDGSYTLQVRAVDAAGNTSAPESRSYLLDRTAPPVVAFSGTPTTPGTGPVISWSFTAPEGTRLQCRLLAPDGATGWQDCDGLTAALRTTTATAIGSTGTYRLDLTGRPDGDYVLEVRVVEADGRVGAPSSATFRLDTLAPSAPRFSDLLPGDAGTAATARWLWDVPGDDEVQCRLLKGSNQVTGWAPCTSPYAVDLSRFGEGVYTLEIRLVDAAGNVGPAAGRSYHYDLTKPLAPVFTSRPPASGSDRTVVWTFTVPTGLTATCQLSRGRTVLPGGGPCSGRYVMDLTGLPDGVYTLTVHLTDAAGNVSNATVGSYALSTRAAGVGRIDPPSRPGPSEPFPPSGPSGPGPVAAPVPGPGRGGSGPVVSGPRQGSTPVTAVPRLPGEDDLVRSSTAGPVSLPRNEQRAAAPEPVGEEQLVVPRRELGDVALGEVPNVIGNVVTETIKRPTLPLALLAIVLLFLLAQNRIDRRDPKLASAPVDAEPELDFTLIVRRPGEALP